MDSTFVADGHVFLTICRREFSQFVGWYINVVDRTDWDIRFMQLELGFKCGWYRVFLQRKMLMSCSELESHEDFLCYIHQYLSIQSG